MLSVSLIFGSSAVPIKYKNEILYSKKPYISIKKYIFADSLLSVGKNGIADFFRAPFLSHS